MSISKQTKELVNSKVNDKFKAAARQNYKGFDSSSLANTKEVKKEAPKPQPTPTPVVEAPQLATVVETPVVEPTPAPVVEEKPAIDPNATAVQVHGPEA